MRICAKSDYYQDTQMELFFVDRELIHALRSQLRYGHEEVVLKLVPFLGVRYTGLTTANYILRISPVIWL